LQKHFIHRKKELIFKKIDVSADEDVAMREAIKLCLINHNTEIAGGT
jgi:hypothetical protein